jgi:hypothetical protein
MRIDGRARHGGWVRWTIDREGAVEVFVKKNEKKKSRGIRREGENKQSGSNCLYLPPPLAKPPIVAEDLTRRWFALFSKRGGGGGWVSP